MSLSPLIVLLAGLVVFIPLGVFLVLYLIVPVVKGIGWLVRHLARFAIGEVKDALRIVGAVVTGLVFVPLTIGSIVLGRWSAASHYGRAIQDEVGSIGGALYRCLIGHPARLLCLDGVTEGLEHRLPEVVAAAPGSDRPSRRTGQFEGYEIIGSLAGGGSGGKLYVARPSPQKLAAFARAGTPDVREVVIKSFSLRDGSSLPQIVRESRSLEAARKLGLVLDHELASERFFYVMPYVPGEPLGVVTPRLHARSGLDGLDRAGLASALAFARDLVRTLDHYHGAGLWHKDIKPDNIIVCDGRAHLVDFGLVTPLRSSMTLTTHGTEYFRDPEMVRLALKGVKVHEVNGAKFDIYGAGAVLFSMIENSFPAHGGLSQITRPCPEALRWVVRRAMAEYDKRYESAALMLADLDAIAGSPDPFAVRPADLPSMRGTPAPPLEVHEPAGHPMPPMPAAAAVYAAGTVPPPAPRGAAPAPRSRPRLRVTHWLSGRYEVVGHAPPDPAGVPDPAVRRDAGSSRPLAPGRRSAAEQLHAASARMRHRRERIAARRAGHRRRTPGSMNMGVVAAILATVAVVGGSAASILAFGLGRPRPSAAQHDEAVQRLMREQFEAGFDPEVWAREFEKGFDKAAWEAAFRKGFEPAPHLPPGVPEIPAPPGGRPEGARREPPARAAASGERILVVRDPIAFGSPVADALRGQVGALHRAGFEIIDPAAGETGTVDPELAFVEASLRKAVGVQPIGSEGAREAVERWLGEQDHLDAVLWIGTNPATGDGALSWLVPSPSVSREAAQAARGVLRSEPGRP